jgi:hypothetical protein
MWQPEPVGEREHVAPRRRAAHALAADRDGAEHEPRHGLPERRAVPRGAGGPARGLHDVTERYGWRAYALPVLVLITALALLTAGNRATSRNAARNAARPAPSAPPVAAGNIALKSDQPGAGSVNTALKASDLPAGSDYTNAGTGTFQVLPGSGPVVGSGQLFRYSVEAENGISGVDLTQYATLVQATLSDPRSWAGHGVALQRVDSGPVDFHVSLVSVMTVRSLCGYDIPVETSCYVPAGPGNPANRVVLNLARWVRGDAAYVGDLNAYRVYMINHEDGHAIGHQHAHECLPGGLAPVMMQQTIGLKSAVSGAMCQANPWPYPPGVAGVPGAEQPDTPQNSEFGLIGD